MNERTLSGQPIRAVVVGVERYAAGDDWNLAGPANDAREFIELLLENGVAPSAISAFVNTADSTPIYQQGLDSSIRVHEPTLDRIYSELAEFTRIQTVECFLFFWGGHGITDPDGHFRLITADASQLALRNIDLDDLLISMRSTAFPQILHQIFMVDACRRYVSRYELSSGLPTIAFPRGDLVDREQFVLCSTREGHLATNSGASQRGLFASSLLQELKSAGSGWITDMEGITARVRMSLGDRQVFVGVQTPVYLWHRGYDGTFESGPVGGGGAVHLSDREYLSERQYVQRLGRRLEVGLAQHLRLRAIGPQFEALATSSVVTRARATELGVIATRREVEDVEGFLKAQPYPRIAIAGPSGSGKTTLINLVALEYSRRYELDERLLPVLITEHGLDVGHEEAVEDLVRRRAPLQDGEALSSFLGRCVLIFDAYEELPEAVRARISEFLRTRPGAMFLLSCRSTYNIELMKIPNCELVEILPFNPPEIHKYVSEELGLDKADRLFQELLGESYSSLSRVWTEAGGDPVAFWDISAASPSAMTWEATTGRRALVRDPPLAFRLAQTPYVLSMLTKILRSGGGLEVTRPEMFRRFVELLIARVQESGYNQELSVDDVLLGLGRVAVHMISRNLNGLAILAAMELVGAQQGERDPDATLRLATRAGLLTELDGLLCFADKTLRAYCAAAYLARLIPAEASVHDFVSTDIWWDETPWWPVMPFVPSFQGRISTLVRWLAEAQPELAALCVRENSGRVYEGASVAFVRDIVSARLRDRDVREPAEAAALGRALSMLGDNRRGVGCVRSLGTALPDIDWVHVPEQDVEEVSGQRKRISAFLVSRYPITNLQYEAFLTSGGYDDAEYWMGRGWRLRDLEGWTSPALYGFPFDLPSHPVVGISWHEALAFCRWMSMKTGATITLPSVLQWMAAARSRDGVDAYPWGAEFDQTKCNSRQSGIGATTAVGVFPAGESSYGLLDCGGNVWEFCLPPSPVSRWRRTSFIDVLRGRTNAEVVCPLKGGSFAHYWCSVRTDVDVYAKEVDREWDVGFRPVKHL